jgi:hypothetical protein
MISGLINGIIATIISIVRRNKRLKASLVLNPDPSIVTFEVGDKKLKGNKYDRNKFRLCFVEQCSNKSKHILRNMMDDRLKLKAKKPSAELDIEIEAIRSLL